MESSSTLHSTMAEMNSLTVMPTFLEEDLATSAFQTKLKIIEIRIQLLYIQQYKLQKSIVALREDCIAVALQ